jgi:PAS domain S-box-containing protein
MDDRLKTPGDTLPESPSRRRVLPRSLISFLAILTTGWIATSALPHWGGRALWLLPGGLAFASVLRWGQSQSFAVFAAEVVVELLRGHALVPSLIVASGVPIGASVMAALLKHYRINAALDTGRNGLFFIGAAIAGTMIAALIGGITMAVYYPVDPADRLSWGMFDFLRWWFNNLAGVLLIGPVLLTISRSTVREATIRRGTIAACAPFAIGLAVVVLFIPSPLAAQGAARAPVLAVSAMLVVVMALRVGAMPTAAVAALLSLVEAIAYSFDLGVYRSLSDIADLVSLWSFIGTMIALTLGLSILLAEQRETNAKRERVEAEMQRNHERLRNVIDGLTAFVGVFSTDGPLLDINRASLEAVGVARGEVLGTSVQELPAFNYSPTVALRAREAHRAAADGTITRYDEVLRFADGLLLSVDLTFAPVRSETGTIAQVVVSGVDITQRKAAEEALRHSERKFSIIFRQASLPAILMRRPAYIVVDVNDAWLALFGYSLEEVVGRNGLEAGFSRNTESRASFLTEFERNGVIRDREQTLFTKDGTARTMLINVNAIVIDGADHAITTMQDVTERKVLEGQLAAESARAQGFLRNANDGVHILDTTGRVVEVSNSFCEMLGYAREEMLGMHPSEWDARRSFQQIAASLEGVVVGEQHQFETMHRRKDGECIEVEIRSNSFEADGRRYIYCSARDLTEVKRLERALIVAISDEQRRFGQEMHDGLGQELTGLSLGLKALATRAERLGLPLAADLSSLAASMAHAIKTARDIVRGLSPLSDAGGDLVRGLEGIARVNSTNETQIGVTADRDVADILPVESRGHLFRIAQEAVQNVLKYAAARHVEIGLGTRNGDVVLSIVDDGRGIQSDATAEGGFGMQTMKFRASVVGGRLSIGASPGGGTAVTCFIPQTAMRRATKTSEK